MRLILGSSSPRRKEIFNFFALPYEQVSPDYDESSVPFSGDPAAYTRELAEGKALSFKALNDAALLTADTIVHKDGKLYPKPANEEEGQRTLAELSGGWHTVYTAVCARKGDQLVSEVAETRVRLKNLTPSQIRRYHQVLHCADKAGAYAVQGSGSIIVEAVEGCYYNVVGLPIQATTQVLLAVGLDLWDFLRPL